MKAVILAAGRSTRTYPLTATRPKPLLKVANKTLLQHNLEQLEGLIDEAIIIVGYKADMIKKEFGDSFNDIKLTYAEQKEQLGSGHAVQQAEEHVSGQFLVMNGDDLYFRKDIKKTIAAGKDSAAILVKKEPHYERYGVVIVKDGKVKKFVERPQEFVSDMTNTGLYIFPELIFTLPLKKSPRGELEIVDYITALIAEGVAVVEAEQCFRIGYPWDLLEANKYLLSLIEKDIKGEVENNVMIKGSIIIGKGTIIKSGTYIEGPCIIGENCTIGPNAYIRASTTIGNNCKIGHEVEIKNCIIMDNSAVPHLSYVGDSVLGENVNLGAGSITANFRHDAGLIRSSVVKDAGDLKESKDTENELVDTGRKKFGTIIGDNCKIGIKTIIYPGRKIWNGKSTLPGEIVKKDVM